MAFSINRVTLVGNITGKPELKYTQSGVAVCSFGLATNHSVKEGETYKDIPTFHNIIVWRKTGEWIANNTDKGMRVYVEGRITYRMWESDGVKKYRTEIVAENVIPMAGERKQQSEQHETAGKDEGLVDAEDFEKFMNEQGIDDSATTLF